MTNKFVLNSPIDEQFIQSITDEIIDGIIEFIKYVDTAGYSDVNHKVSLGYNFLVKKKVVRIKEQNSDRLFIFDEKYKDVYQATQNITVGDSVIISRFKPMIEQDLRRINKYISAETYINVYCGITPLVSKIKEAWDSIEINIEPTVILLGMLAGTLIFVLCHFILKLF